MIKWSKSNQMVDIMRRSAKDSIQGKHDAVMAAKTKYSVPEGLAKLTKREQTVWDQYTPARTRWKGVELRILHKVVKHETSLEKLQREAAKTPFMSEDKWGKAIPHPIHKELDTALKTHMSLIRNLGLTVSPGHKGTVNGEGAAVEPNAPTGSNRGKKMSLVK